MTTVVNSPATPAADTGYGFLLGAVLLIAFVSVILYFGIPAIQHMGPIQLNIPATQVVMPNKVDVNVVPAK